MCSKQQLCRWKCLVYDDDEVRAEWSGSIPSGSICLRKYISNSSSRQVDFDEEISEINNDWGEAHVIRTNCYANVVILISMVSKFDQ